MKDELKWEDVQHIEGMGSIQIARMQDGTFILVSIGLTTALVLTALNLQSVSDYREIKSFIISGRLLRFSEKELREMAQGMNMELLKPLQTENVVILERLRSIIKSPRTVDELTDILTSPNCPNSI